MSSSPSVLSDALDGWTPEPVSTVDAVSPWAVAGFSALLDLDPVAGDGDPLPPLWHWFAFLDTPPSSALGDDGHPAHGRFLPPVPDRRRMFAGGRLSWYAPWHVGEPVERTTAVDAVRIREGRTGEMAFVTTRAEFRRAGSGGELLAVEEQDVVYRSQPAGSVRGIAAPEPAPRPEHEWGLTLPTGPVLLFRMSALTANAHRIHYDEPYATGVEGYPGLVVHGPLLALLGLEVLRRHRTDTTVGRFEYRLTAPAFAGPDLWAGASRSGDGLAVGAGADGAPPSLTGTVTPARH
ncbi:MaoC family dehydratase N-terminal domain-containing protein [Pseudonocardia nematodicida]|uniref:MaoC family dehydratase N-terminal domain-containing protein n=1 Tax=Pseudonocardia nematodicida TaxID=1206997 RepID=A0ABV1KFP7_9PSEU